MESLNPLVSVVLPVRQWRDTTRIAIDSLLAQSFGAFEIILVTQAETSTVPDWLACDTRIKLVKRKRAGIVNALNTGLAAAQGQFIARMDDDDIAYPKRLEYQLAYLHANTHIDICGCRIRFVDSHGTVEKIANGNLDYQQWLNALSEPEAIRLALFRESPLPHPTLMAHRTVWHALGGYAEMDGPEDYDLLLRAMLKGNRMGKPIPILQDWREHEDRLTYIDKRYRRQAFVERAAWACAQPESGMGLDSGRQVWICGTGKRARDWHDALLSRGIGIRGFVDNKAFDPVRRKRMLPVIDYQQLETLRKESLVILAVTQHSAKALLARYCAQLGWQNGKEYIIGG